jgi:hypothetical protein
MVLPILQIFAIAAIALYFLCWRRGVRQHSEETWDSLLLKLRIDWSARELNENFLWKEGLTATPEDAWQKMDGAKGLWAMYQNAQVMQQMANYATRNCEDVDRLLVENIHSDALQIRVCVLVALAQYGFTKASEGVRINAYRAALLYSDMAVRMTRLLQEHAAVHIPDFVASM